MSIKPFRFSNDLSNDGAIKQFLSSEEDYLAYRAGKYLSNITKTESSSLTDNIEVPIPTPDLYTTEYSGSFTDTIYVKGNPSEAPRIHTRSYGVNVFSIPEEDTHEVIFDDTTPLPPLVYEDDSLQIIFNITLITSQNGFEEIQTALGFGNSSIYNIDSINNLSGVIPSIDGSLVKWERYEGNRLQGSLSVAYNISFTDTGYIPINLSVVSVDIDNLQNPGASFNFNTFTRVENADAPGISEISTNLYQVNTNIEERGFYKVNPVFWDETRGGLKEMNELELDLLCERIISNIMTNERPGTYRLANESPGPDWEIYLENIFVDTRATVEGLDSSIGYSIYIRKSDIEPAVYKPLYPLRNQNEFK